MLRRSSRGGVPGLEPAPREADRLDRFSQIARRRLPRAPGRPLLAADVDQAVQKRAGRDDERAARRLAHLELKSGDAGPSIRIRPARRGSMRCSVSARALVAPKRRIAACRPALSATTRPARGCD